ncbi:MAG TPA: hypothetical protein VFQ74_01665 [Pseudolysinimonas sp.]|nr:hypothetical protein [Pseudolysinimonas sp.]
MSAVAVARPLRHPSGQPAGQPRRHLEVVPTRAQRRARPRMLPALITIGGIGVILLAQLLLSIVIADGAYQISGLQSAKHDAVLQQHALSEQLDLLASPQHLAANAEALGMVASGSAVYLDAKTGAVTGNGSAVGGSMLGSGDQVGNVLLTDTALVTPNATGSSTTTSTTTATGARGDSQTPTDAGAGGAGQDPQTPGLLPSPTTH